MAAPKRDKNVGSFHGSRIVSVVELKTHVLSGDAVHARDVRAQQHVDAFVPEQLRDRPRDIGIFIGGKRARRG